MSSGIGPNGTFFASLLKGSILDCGCGIGVFRPVLQKQGNVVGVDIERKYLLESKYEDKVLASATHLPFNDETFDGVWACAILEHIAENCISEICRVGRTAIFTVPNYESPLDFLHSLQGKETWFSKKWHPDHVHPYPIKELAKYGKVYGCDPAFPPRNLWNRIVPMQFWIRFPWLCHTITLIVKN